MSDESNQVIDSLCFLCGDSLPPVPEEMDAKEYYYIFGFGDGATTALRAEGHPFCDKHHGLIRKALLERGVNWGKR